MRVQRTQRRARRAGLGLVVAAALVLLGAGEARAVDPNAQDEQAAKVNKKADEPERRPWFVDFLFETHWMVVRDNLPDNDIYHMFYLRGGYDIPKVGQLAARLDVTRRYVSDPQESGVLFGDALLYFSRGFKVDIAGQDFGVRPYFYWTFPTSKVSQKEGNIGRPMLLVALTKSFPFGLDAFVRPFVRLHWMRYAEAEGGQPNRRWMLGFDMLVNYAMPFHKRLSVGGDIGVYWQDRYASREGLSQPFNSAYWWELYAGYTFLQKPVTLEAYLALTSGRWSVEDGVSRFHVFDRDETEMYLSLHARY